MRIMIAFGVAAALALAVLFASYGDNNADNSSQASVSTGTVYNSELSLQEYPVSLLKRS